MNKTMYVAMLTEKEQKKIEKYLMRVPSMTVKGLNNMMDGRLCDMEEVVSWNELQKILN